PALRHLYGPRHRARQLPEMIRQGRMATMQALREDRLTGGTVQDRDHQETQTKAQAGTVVPPAELRHHHLPLEPVRVQPRERRLLALTPVLPALLVIPAAGPMLPAVRAPCAVAPAVPEALTFPYLQ